MSSRFLEHPDILDTIGIVIQSIALLFCIPLMVIHMIMLVHQCKMDETVQKLTSERELPIILCLNVLCIVELCLNLPLMLISTVWIVVEFPSWLMMFVYSVFWDAISILYAVKTWKLYYKQQLNIAVAAKLWQKQINPNVESWYIKNQHKYANNLYLFKLLFPIYLFLILTSTALEAVFVESTPDEHAVIVHVSNALFNSLPLIAALFIFCKSKEINDEFGIRNEFKTQTIFLWIFLAIYSVEFVMFNSELVISMNMQQGMRLRRVEYLLYGVNIVFINCILALSSTLYPLYMARKKRIGTTDPDVVYNYLDTGSSDRDAILSLTDAIADEKGFRSLMQHLITQFSTETLLFITEVVQCKYVYAHCSHSEDTSALLTSTSIAHTVFHNTTYDAYDMDGMADGSVDITLPPAITYSDVLMDPRGQFRELTVHEAMYKLYLKYVMEESPFCINISGEMRARLHTVFSGEDDATSSLLDVFDEAAIDMLWALQDIWSRFQSSCDLNSNALLL